MAAASDYATLLTALGPKNASGFIAALEERGVYVIDSLEDPQDLIAGNILSILFNGVLFWYDPADATTVHDGVTCIVTSEGRRYKSDQYSGISSRWVAVKDKDLTAPPGAPALQDTYIVAAGGSGAWAGKDKKFATWTARGWVFLTPKAFDYAYVIDESLIYHYSAGGAWTSGIPAITVADSSLSRNKLNHFKLGTVGVENQTTTAPPGGPAAGVAYVVGGGATGAWAGHDLDVAIFESGNWVFYDGYEGAQVYDRALDKYYRFNGATWDTPAANLWSLIQEQNVAGLTTVDFIGLSAYRVLKITFVNVRPTNDQRAMNARISLDNGANFIVTSTYTGSVTSWTLTAASGAGSLGNAAGDGGLGGQALILDWNVAQKTKIISNVVYGDDGGGNVATALSASQSAQTAMNALRFFLTTGTFAGGAMILEGMA